ncbi:MAG TPA: kelch repeat-containing protein [Polyangium sp.]|nr:kelch repeat-containing protein [Polyangium sp.]
MRIGKCRALAILTGSLIVSSCTPQSPPPIESELDRSTSQASSTTTYWNPAAVMLAQRKAHAALPLADSRVLVVGAIDPVLNPGASVAELYTAPTTDLPKGEWKPLLPKNGFTISTTTDCRPALTQLGNGLVLVVTDRMVWSIDLANDAWLPMSLPVTDSTCKPQIAALPNNRALILADVGTGEAFIYDSGMVNPTVTPIPTPTKGSWIDSAVIALTDGSVLISGGGNEMERNDQAVIYVPSTEDSMPEPERWDDVGNMFYGRSEHAIALLANNNVLVAGGRTQGTIDDQYSDTAEIFNVQTMQWSPTTNMRNHRNLGPQAVQLPSGFVLVVGGSNSSTAELFDPSTSQWSLIESMDDTRFVGHESTILDDGRVLVTGGAGDDATDEAALCDALAFTWERLTPIGAANRVFHSATKLTDGRMLIVGGRTSDAGTGTVLQDAWLYDPKITDPTKDPWSSAGSTNATHALHTATQLTDGRVLIVGGVSGAFPELFDSSSNTWTATDTTNAPIGVARATATLLNDGQVLIVGGYSTKLDGSYDKAETTVYLYNPTSGTWTNSLALPAEFAGAIGHSATLLTDESVLIVGGFDTCPTGTTPVPANAQAARFIPKTMTWESADPLELPRAFHSATLLPNGLVVLTGGGGSISDSCMNPSWGSVYTSTLIYEQSRKVGEQWTYAGTMTEARTGHQAVLLDGGRLLVAGGLRDNFGNALSSAEVFDFANKAWSSTSRMQYARYGHTLAALDGGVVALGGYLPFAPSSKTTTSVERFPQAALGQRCTYDDQCITNICADGVCCDMACDSDCLSCTKVGYENIAKLGEGYCEDISPCSPFACVLETGDCGMTCTDVDGCATGFVCDPTGNCVAPLPNASKLDETGCTAAPAEPNSLSWVSFAVVAGAYAFRRRNAQRKS